MIVLLKKDPDTKQLQNLIDWLKSMSLDIHISKGSNYTVLGLIGDTSAVDIDLIQALGIVDSVKRIQEPFKSCNRKFHPDDTVIDIYMVKLGGGNFQIIAGPCSVESEAQVLEVAHYVKAAGATILRGGAFKPRSSPYAFQGLREAGIKLLLEAKAAVGLPIVTEIMDISQLHLFEEIDIIQVGARNMQNFELLKALGKTAKPILLKRGLSSTIDELLMSAEYIMASGNENVILCERGIRTFETYTRNTLDISAVPVLKNLSHLPVIVDPSHATGMAALVPPMSLAAAAARNGRSDHRKCIMIAPHASLRERAIDDPGRICGTGTAYPENCRVGQGRSRLMNVAVIGLGLIGGSIAKAAKQNTEHRILGMDINESVRLKAKLLEAIDEICTSDDLPNCDMLILALHPRAAEEWLQQSAARLKEGALVVDCCGTKRKICQIGFELAEKYRFHFIGGHPMAGIERSGFDASSGKLFSKASMILTPRIVTSENWSSQSAFFSA